MMKKYFLKGKQLLTKKLEQLQIETQAIDYVNEQIPNKLKQPLSILQHNIDLQETQKYEMYFKMYPNHHLSSFLLDKFQVLVSAKIENPLVVLPKIQIQGKDQIFVPKFDSQLQNKALLLKQVVQQYQQGYFKTNQAIVCVSVIHFHHKRGAQVQYTYPKTQAALGMQNLIVHHSMPDSSHNKNQDYNFFNFEAIIKGRKRMLFGVSYFKQIKVTQQHRQQNKQLTRSYLQKAISIISYLPLFGYLKLRLTSTVKVFFNDFNNFNIIQEAYKDLERNLLQSWDKITVNQLYTGSDLRTIINLFGTQDFYQIWKAVLYQKRIVVFAHSSSSASSFILSLLTLFPGLSSFGIYSKEISKYMQGLREYGLPLKIFSCINFMSMSFHIQDFHLLLPFQKNKKGSFFVGTTNRLLKQHNDYGVQLLINLQNCTIQKRKLPQTNWQTPNKREKAFIQDLNDIMMKERTLGGFNGGQDNIRNLFHNFIKESLVKIATSIKQFKRFVKDCKQYQRQTKSKAPKRKGSKGNQADIGIELNEQDDQQQFNQSLRGKDFPPVLPQAVANMPFPHLLLSPSFQFFLQFHNQNLPELISGKVIPCLLIDNFKYFLKLQQQKFVLYDWHQKKLVMGKGSPKSFDGKQVRFHKHFQQIDEQTKTSSIDSQVRHIKSIYVGSIQNGKYMKNGYYLDKSQLYEGDFHKGMKQGYGKLTNAIHKYIGNFQQDLYSGQGQMVTNKEIYVGEFREGLRNGQGKNQSHFNGLNYDGEWLNDKPEGNGIFKDQQKTEIIGAFKAGKLDQTQETSLRYEDGRMYKGYIKNGKPQGKGFIVDRDGQLKIGYFQNGQLINEEKEPNNQNLVRKVQVQDQKEKQNKVPLQKQYKMEKIEVKNQTEQPVKE